MSSPVLPAIFLLVFCAEATAQKTPEEYLLEQARLKRMMLTQEVDSGVYFMDKGEYDRADAKFRHVLANIKGVPSDLAYYFGKNSYLRRQYSQSIDWLNKYIQLKGMNGQFSADAVKWLRKAEEGVRSARAQETEKSEQVLSSTYEIDCGPTGKVICPVCRGDHVIIKKGAFGDQYQTCGFCNEHGILTCEEYNLLIRGELEPKF
jgi:tetratricopeptide (TPR) repeat protein